MKPTRIRVYVAGPYNASNVMDVLDNIRRGIRVSVEVMRMGFAPFCPFLDFLFQLLLRPGETLTIQDYYDYSMSWLEASHVVYVLPGYEISKGTLKEIERAKELGIPVTFYESELLRAVGEIQREFAYAEKTGRKLI